MRRELIRRCSEFVGAIASLLRWRERLTPWLALGGVCMAVGVWLHATERHEHRHVHEAMHDEHPH